MSVRWKPQTEGIDTTWTEVEKAVQVINKHQLGKLFSYDEENVGFIRRYFFAADGITAAELKIQWILYEGCSTTPYNPTWLTVYGNENYVVVSVD